MPIKLGRYEVIDCALSREVWFVRDGCRENLVARFYYARIAQELADWLNREALSPVEYEQKLSNSVR